MADVIYKKGQSINLDNVEIAEGQILVTEDTGEMYVDMSDGTRKKINPQADWQQNDETANDYVKNRPGGYDRLTEILPETTLNFDSNSLTLTNCPPIEVGKEYIVTFDGTEYELVGQDSGSDDYIYIGNETHSWCGGTDTGEPFIIYNYGYDYSAPDIYIDPSMTFPCTYNIKIKAITPIKIDEKYFDVKNANIVNGSTIGSLRTIGSAKESSEYEMGMYAFAEGDYTTASGEASHAEGGSTTALGYASHAEGAATQASGSQSHAEGEYAQASGDYSHAEGEYTAALGTSSHAEGDSTEASGYASHAEGYDTTALGRYSHAEGNNTLAGQMGFKVTACEKLTDTTGTYTLSSITGLSTNQRYSVHLSLSKYNCGKITAIDTTNNKITVDGYPNIALSTNTSSTANYLTIVNKPKLGDIFISGDFSHAEGNETTASGKASHAEGYNTTASGDYSHAEGYETTASGDHSHAEGISTTAFGDYSHAEGTLTTAFGDHSHAEGNSTTASGYISHAEGISTTASSEYQHVQGKFNIEDTANIYADIIGNGSDEERSNANAATVDWQGNAWYAGAVTSNGADYAEFFEWLDGNPNNEDRVGYLVALDGEKIRFANPEDEILGIISANPAILGDNYECNWNGKYLTDEFGRILYDKVEEFIDIPKVDEETGETTIEKKSLGFFDHPRINPDYDPDQEYINRRNRSEWAMVGMFGKLFVRDDGTAQINGYVSTGEGGIATASTEKTNMRVLSRVNDHIVKVLLK